MKSDFIVVPLSNGNISLLTNMDKHARLPWDCILSAELSKHYKPDREIYLTATELLGLSPQQVMMVSAHVHDLNGAKAIGMKTAFVHRPFEFGSAQSIDLQNKSKFDISAGSFFELAEILNA